MLFKKNLIGGGIRPPPPPPILNRVKTIKFVFYFTSDLWGLMLLNKQSLYISALEDDNSLVQMNNSNGYTIFHDASSFGRLQVMEAINNIDPHMKDQVTEDNETPLMWASRSGQKDSVVWLLDHDADVRVKDVKGNTAVNKAKTREIRNMIRIK